MFDLCEDSEIKKRAQAIAEFINYMLDEEEHPFKTANVLNKLPKSLHINAKRQLHEIYMAPTEVEACKALDKFVATHPIYEPD